LPDPRRHRGPDPRDAVAFDEQALPRLRQGVADYGWLLSRGYAELSALKLVGDRYHLTERQRMAVRRCSCPDVAVVRRAEHQIDIKSVSDQPLCIDGFNVLMTLEAGLGGAVVLIGRDGCARDLLGIHGTYRRVLETGPALELLGNQLVLSGVTQATWLLDSPVSNSGRLKGVITTLAMERGWKWNVELVINPDPILATSSEIVVTSDAAILDRCKRWVNLARMILESEILSAWRLNLCVEPDSGVDNRT
jgi:hypothetical protein